ncbi:MAG: AI-2E family transporter [Alphaproteobacteria bacterium]|nr:AI-2E family transporter [Alphaproteobacteria bacterium]
MSTRLADSVLLLGIGLMTVLLLAHGRDVLIPIAVSIFVWYLLNALARVYGRLTLGSHSPPRWLCLSASILTMLAAALLMVEVVSRSIAAVAAAAHVYQKNLERLITDVSMWLGFEKVPTTAEIVDRIDLEALATALAGSAASFAMTFTVVLFYVAFLLVEQKSFDKKIAATIPDPKRRRHLIALLGRIQSQIQEYIWIKFVIGLLAAVATFAVLVAVGVDFAILWAFVVFLLGFIPTIGTLLSIIFPSVLALLQFDTLTPFLIVIACLTPVQLLLHNWIEPHFMGSSLNLSPLVIVMGLAISTAIWGIIGAVLCVPIMVIAGIILAQFPGTRWIAIAMSSDGDVRGVTAPPTGD